MRRIILCIDFSEFTESVIRAGAEFAQAMKSELCLVHVTRPHLNLGGGETTTEVVRHDLAEQYKEEHEKLQEFSQKLRDQGLQARALLLEGGPIDETIRTEAKKLGADLIIVGSQGHSRLGGLVLGSVSQNLMQGLEVAVMVVPKG